MQKAIFQGVDIRNRLQSKWSGMNTRCLNPKVKSYKAYSKTGICNRWRKFENFYNDVVVAYVIHLGEHGFKNTTIERIDNNKGYSPENCRWATRLEQTQNRTLVSKKEMRKCRFCNENFLAYIKNGRTGCNDEKCKKIRPAIFLARKKERARKHSNHYYHTVIKFRKSLS